MNRTASATAAPTRPTGEPPAISLQHVSKRYRMTHHPMELKTLVTHPWRWFGRHRGAYHWAVRDVSFTVRPGEFFSIVGANGSGKSTLLRIMAGLALPTSGTIAANGRISSLLELGSGFHPQVSGRENAILNGLLAGLTRRQMESLMPEIVRFAGLQEFIDEPMRTYSSGMHVRLGFAIAAFLEPEILLVDEVLAVGDAKFQEKCYEHIASLQARGVTIVMVSHDLAAVERFSTRAALMEHGRMLRIGDPHSIVSEHVERLADSSPEIRQALEEAIEAEPERLEDIIARDPEAMERFEKALLENPNFLAEMERREAEEQRLGRGGDPGDER